jgi:hypothetical protein
LAALRHEGVEVDQRSDLVGQRIRHSRHHHAAIGVADQHDVRQFLVFEDIDDVGDVGVEVDARVHEMRTLAESGQGRREDLMAGLAQRLRVGPPAPAADPGAMDQNKVCHCLLLDAPHAIGAKARCGCHCEKGSPPPRFSRRGRASRRRR